MMNVQFVEKYTKLSELEEGQVAVSKDRNEFFVCGHHYCKTLKLNKKIILNVNKLWDQYTENIDLNQPVKVLKSGDKFVCEV